MTVKFNEGDNPFFTWMDDNPDGFVLNTGKTSASSVTVLHKSGCAHLTGMASGQGPDDYTTKGYIKICAESASEVMAWTIRNRRKGNGISHYCKDCFASNEAIQHVWQSETTEFGPEGAEPDSPKRAEEIVSRIIRNTALAQGVKSIHEYKCQLCSRSVELYNGRQYAEAHHMRPLGAPHNGPDVVANIICVCPAHHVQLDYGAIPLSHSELIVTEGHPVDEQFIEYHNHHIYKGHVG